MSEKHEGHCNHIDQPVGGPGCSCRGQSKLAHALASHPPIPLAEQIAAVERVVDDTRRNLHISRLEIDRLAAALATLRGLLLIEETR